MTSNLDKRFRDKSLTWLLALLLAIAVAPPVLLAQVPVTVFPQGGTLTQDIQGESAY